MTRWFFRPVGGEWRIAAWCFGFMAGAALAPLGTFIAGVLAPLLILSAVALLYRRRWVLLLLLLMGACCGYSVARPLWVASSWGRGISGEVQLTGRVSEDPLTERHEISFVLSDVVIDGRVVAGMVWVRAGAEPAVRGDRVTVRGDISQGFGVYSAAMYRASIISIERDPFGDIGRVVRDWFSERVRQYIPEPQASLGLGFITGQKSALPEDLAESLRIVGLTHIVVASGYNLTILVRATRRIFRNVSRFLSFWSAAALIMSFVAVAGLSPSMTRAAVVSVLSLLLLSYGRVVHPVVLLGVVGAATVAWRPSFAWGDVGWMLSFSAFAGVMLLAPLLQRYLFGKKEPGMIRQIAGETVSAHLVTIPILVVYFGTISHVAIIANLLVVPLVPLAMLLTFLVGVIGFVVPWAAPLLGTATGWLLEYMTTVATYLAGLPWAQSEVGVVPSLLVLYVVGIGLVAWHMKRVTRYQFVDYNPVK